MQHRILPRLLLVCFIFMAVSAVADETQPGLQVIDMSTTDGDGDLLDGYLWSNRILVVFADSPDHPLFVEQIELLLTQPDDLVDRDVVILTDTEPSAESPLRTKLRPRGFALVIIGKDGGVGIRKPFPWSVREIGRAIDKMPLRQLELQSK